MSEKRKENVAEQAPSEFWAVIEGAGQDPARFRESLKAMDADALVRFLWTYEELAAHVRGRRHARHADADLSEDGMAELANWVVALGKQRYSEILEHPDRIPKRHRDSGFPSQLVEAYEERTGDDDIPYNDNAWDPKWREKGKRDPWS